MYIKKRNFQVGIFVLLSFIMMAANVESPPIKIGDKAPDFTVQTVNGDNISLNDYKGKITVIHLWSHTCPHCRLMNKTLPGIVAPYKKANLAYIMIDIDIDTTGWRNIIKEDKLDFAIHATDPHDGAAKTAVDYNLQGTPCVNITDEKGNLIAVDVTASQLKKILRKRFPKV